MAGEREANREICNIVLADDSEDDRFLLSRILAELINGDQVVEYLTGEGEYADRGRFPIPSVLILDEVMPRKSGREVVEWIAQHPQPGMKIILLTGSERERMEGMNLKFPDVVVVEKSALLQQLNHIVRVILDMCEASLKPTQ